MVRPGNVTRRSPARGVPLESAYTQVIVSEGSLRTVYVSGQNALDDRGRLVGKGDFRAQLEQVYRNLQQALEAADAGIEHAVKWKLYLLEGQTFGPGFVEFSRGWGMHPPATTILFVAALAHQDYLVEMDAIAVVPLDPA